MASSTIEKAVDFFGPLLDDKCYVTFYGGEPLLAFDKIKEIISVVELAGLKQNVRFGLTTNGSLLTGDKLDFMSQHRFSINVSFDGVAQEISRKSGSYDIVHGNLEKALSYKELTVKTNSVFSPETISYLAVSMQLIANMGVTDASFSISTLSPWSDHSLKRLKLELKKLKEFALDYYKEHGRVPITSLRPVPDTQQGIFGCAGGNSRMALAPDGILWGCFLFWDYFKEKKGTKDYQRFCFGELDDFISRYQQTGVDSYHDTLVNYAALRLDYACCNGEFCMLCDNLEECVVCPINAAFSGSPIGDIPGIVCQVNRLKQEARLVIPPLDATTGQ